MATTEQCTATPDHASGLSGETLSSPAPKSRNAKIRSLALDVTILLSCALIGAFGTKAFVAQIFSVPTGSMLATVAPGDRVLTEKISYRFRPIERGDVVVFDGQDIFDEPLPGASMFVKRVIGVGGDRVECCDADGRLSVNGTSLDETEYLFPGDRPSKTRFDVVVPDGRLWLMGDHRSDSADSRAYVASLSGGFIPVDRVVGRAMTVIWPLSSARSIDSPTYRS